MLQTRSSKVYNLVREFTKVKGKWISVLCSIISVPKKRGTFRITNGYVNEKDLISLWNE